MSLLHSTPLPPPPPTRREEAHKGVAVYLVNFQKPTWQVLQAEGEQLERIPLQMAVHGAMIPTQADPIPSTKQFMGTAGPPPMGCAIAMRQDKLTRLALFPSDYPVTDWV